MVKDILMVYIVLSETDELATPQDPSIGLFSITNSITQGQCSALVYAEDYVGGAGSENLKYKVGFLAQNGIGDIAEAGSFKTGGGSLQNRGVSVELKNTTQLKNRLDGLSTGLMGRQLYIVNYRWNIIAPDEITGELPATEPLPLFAGRIDTVTWDATRVKITAVPNFEAMRRANLMINGLPVTFGGQDFLQECRRVDNDVPKYLSHYCFTGNEAHKDNTLFEVNHWGKLRITGGGLNVTLVQFLRVKLASNKDAWVEFPNGGGSVDNISPRLAEYLFLDPPVQNFFLVGENGEALGGYAVPIGTPRSGSAFYHWSGSFSNDRGVFYDDGYIDIPTLAADEMFVLLRRPLMIDTMPELVRFVRADALFMSDGWPTMRRYVPLSDDQKLVYTDKDGERFPYTLYGEVVDYDRRLANEDPSGLPIHYPLRRALLLEEIKEADINTGLTYANFPARSISPFAGEIRRWELRGRQQDDFIDDSGSPLNNGGGGVYVATSLDDFIQLSPVDDGVGYGNILSSIDGYKNTFTLFASEFSPSGNSDRYYYCIRFILPDMPTNVIRNDVYIALKLEAVVRASYYYQNSLFAPKNDDYLKIRVRDMHDVFSVGPRDRFFPTLTTGWGAWDGGNGLETIPWDENVNSTATVNNFRHETVILPRNQQRQQNLGRLEYDAFLREDDLSGVSIRYNYGSVNVSEGGSWIGYRQFKINNLNFDNGRQKECLLAFGPFYGRNAVVAIRLYEAGVLIEGVVDTKSKIYAYMHGRLRNDEWGKVFNVGLGEEVGRKSPADIIEAPFDIVEYARRLSNWSETRNVTLPETSPHNNWGKDYAPPEYMPLIDTAAFDRLQNTQYDNIRVTRQITDEGEANTDSIVDSICNDFFLVSKKVLPVGDDWLGTIVPPYETIIPLSVPEGGQGGYIPQLSYSDILDFGEVKEPDVGTIFCEPIIQYGYSPATGRYMRSLEVRNISATHWEASFTPGFTTSDGFAAWEKCRRLFRKYHTIVDMPQNLQEQRWIGDYNTAVWKLNRLLDWTQKVRIDITVAWQTGRTWGVGTYIYLSLPHIRNGEALLCVIEGISKRKTSNRIKCNLIYLFDTDAPLGFGGIIETGNAEIVIEEGGSMSGHIVETGTGISGDII